MAKKYKIPCPSNIRLLKAYHNLLKIERIKKNEKLENLLRKRKIRSLSGVVVVSVLTKPYPCPGKCIYCPIEKGMPKSYLSGEPAAERAKKLKFDPYLQVQKRLESLKKQGHPTDKIELRIIGGTFSFYPSDYKIWFLTNCFAAANERKRILKKKLDWEILEKEQKINEKAKQRIVGISIETRPDFIDEKEILNLRRLGVTMVELGIQTIFDEILEKCKRGHGVKEIILATKILKDAGFKVMYQMMPNLPGSNLKKDEKMFEELFSNPDFQPDLLKIYPCALLKEAPLYKLWKAGKYKPYTDNQLIDFIKSIKKKIPYYVRIQRITRDIPSQRILVGGAKISNLRQILAEKIKKENWRCHCIRCREVKEKYNPEEKVYLFRQDYEASGGKEIFLSFENRNRTKLYSLLRLRITSQNKAIVREIHTYGQLVSVAEKNLAPQHRGFGKKIIKETEKIAKKEFDLNKIAVISGFGARNYFRKLGYKLENTYMIKNL